VLIDNIYNDHVQEEKTRTGVLETCRNRLRKTYGIEVVETHFCDLACDADTLSIHPVGHLFVEPIDVPWHDPNVIAKLGCNGEPNLYRNVFA
jgi:hypothetical protein